MWHEQLQKVVEMYDRMSKYEAEDGLVICYGTMYGNTERMAEVIARAASQAGVKNIVVYNVSKTLIRTSFATCSAIADSSWEHPHTTPDCTTKWTFC